jgi:acetyl esterase/lipase
MTMAFTTVQRNIAPPTAILAFYCPSDFEDPCWVTPNFPENSEKTSTAGYNLLEGVQETAITSYNVPKALAAVGGWMSPQDPRSRIVLHMNWKAQFLPVILNGLPHASKVSVSEAEALYAQPQPDTHQIQRISPYAQIVQGTYRTPTYVVHGTEDDLIPWKQTARTVNALKEKGVAAEAVIVEGGVHLFDLYRDTDEKGWEAVCKGYGFLSRHV